MPRRNVLVMMLVVIISALCYQQVDHNPYGRYLSQVLSTIEQRALEPVPQRELFSGAMEGIMSKLDEYSGYISADETREFQAELEQQFGGVGVMIRLEDDPEDPDAPKQLVVVNPPLFGTPAQQAGIQVEDRIVKIDGRSVSGLSMKEIVDLMRGHVGTPVVLTVQKWNQDEPVDLTIQRAIIRVPSVLGDRPEKEGRWNFQLEEDPRIAYIRITSFGEKTSGELAAALQQLEGKNVQGLILDVRDNPGGLLEAAVETCDFFIPGGLPIVSIKGRGGAIEREYFSSGAGTWLDIPLVVLVNKYSASASEIVAACLQDYDRAAIVGTRTWGKGTVQHVIRIEDGRSLLRLTAASYWRPSGKNIHRMRDATEDEDWGVSPDPGLTVELSDEQFRRLHEHRAQRDLLARDKGPLAVPEDLEPAIEEEDAGPVDPQLKKGVEYLQELIDQKASQSQAA